MDPRRWIDHYDHMDPEYVKDPTPVWAELRQRCPVARSDLYGGFWVATRHEDIDRIAHDTTTFSSRTISIPPDLLGHDVRIPPINSDPPEHNKYRRLLLPAFNPEQVAAWEPAARKIADDLTAAFADRDGIEAVSEYAHQVPITVMSRLLGVSEDDRQQFAEWLLSFSDLEKAKTTFNEMLGYLYHQIQEHRRQRRDTVISLLIDTQVDGESLTDGDLISSIFLLLAAGIDTTASAIGACLHHLATNPADRHRLVDALDDDRGLWPLAVEEFLRALVSVSMARHVTQAIEIGGRTLHPGDLVLLPFGSANRDPAVFDDPDEITLDRQNNRHYAFGIGIHRCLGSNLARMELRVALQAFLAQIPDFHLAPGRDVRWSGGPAGQIRGPVSLPLVFDR